MADNWLDSNYQPRAPFATPGPVDPYAPLAPNQWAGQGMGGEPVPFPSPGEPPAYPPQGQQTTGFPEGAQGPAEGGGFAPRQPGESASQYFARKQAAGEQFTPADFMAVEAEQQAMQAYLSAAAGGASSTTTSTTKQNDSPELRELRRIRSHAVAGMGDRMLQTADAAAQAGVEQNQMYATRADVLQAETAAEQHKQDEAAGELRRRQTEVEKASKDYVKAGNEIDPNRFMSGGRGVLAALAMAAGAYGATLGKTQNFAQQIIDAAIDRDLSAQKLALNAKKDALTQTQQSFQNYRAIFQDDAAARAAVRADAREVFATQLGGIASKYRGQEQQAAIMQTRDQLLLQNNQLRQEQAGLAAGRVQRLTTTQSGIPAGAGGTGDIMERMAKAAANAKAFNELNGSEGPTKADESHLNDVAKQAGIWVPVLRRLEAMDKIVGKTGPVDRAFGMSNVGGDFQAADEQFRNAALQAITGAAFSKEQAEAFTNMIHKRAYTAEGYQHKIRQVQEFIAQEIQAKTATLHQAHQPMLRKRMIAGGIPEAVVNSAMTGTSISTKKQYADESGARSH